MFDKELHFSSLFTILNPFRNVLIHFTMFIFARIQDSIWANANE